MPSDPCNLPVGQRILLPGHYDHPVILEAFRPLGTGCELRGRPPDGRLEDVVISATEAKALSRVARGAPAAVKPVDAEKHRLLVESARIRLHDPHFAVSYPGSLADETEVPDTGLGSPPTLSFTRGRTLAAPGCDVV